jgi:hypothetical protein
MSKVQELRLDGPYLVAGKVPFAKYIATLGIVPNEHGMILCPQCERMTFEISKTTNFGKCRNCDDKQKRLSYFLMNLFGISELDANIKICEDMKLSYKTKKTIRIFEETLI